MKIIRPPFNYVGGKYKLLPQLLPLMPENIALFVDVFTGGGSVTFNIKAEKLISNDICQDLIKCFQRLKADEGVDFERKIDEIVLEYKLDKFNAEGYFALREDYNNAIEKDPYKLFTLLCFSFNNDIRFNNQGKFNVSFGRNRSSFNSSIRERVLQCCDYLKSLNVEFTNLDFSSFFVQNLDTILQNPDRTFVYFDPPYLITDANYNKFWSEDKELELYSICDYLDNNKIKFGLSNVITHKGKTNDILTRWIADRNYQVHCINQSYANCNYQTSGSSQEVYITNHLT